jgi:hypothetical protein
VNALAQRCGLRVPNSQTARFRSRRHTFLVKRFDRTADNQRVHFASAMTLTGRTDGDDASTGVSYLELARVLINDGAEPQASIRQIRVGAGCLPATKQSTAIRSPLFVSTIQRCGLHPSSGRHTRNMALSQEPRWPRSQVACAVRGCAREIRGQ